MKKLIALSIALTVLASAVFALDLNDNISLSGNIGGTFVPIKVVDTDKDDIPGNDTDESAPTVWAGFDGYPRAEVTLKANWDEVGGQGQFKINQDKKGNFDSGDTFVWIKPWGNFLELKAGQFGDGELEGKVGGGDFGYNLDAKAGGEIFNSLSMDGDRAGFELILKPIEGLRIASMVSGSFSEYKAKELYEKIQVAVGYTIADIGLARVQFKGDHGVFDTLEKPTDKWEVLADVLETGLLPVANAPRVEAAFELTAVENLKVDLGAKIWFAAKNQYYQDTPDYDFDHKERKDGASFTNPLGIALGAEYVLDDFTIRGSVATQIGAKFIETVDGEDYTAKSGLFLNAHLTPIYNLGFATVGAEIGFQVNPTIEFEGGGDSKTINEGGIQFGLGAFIKKPVGAGFIRTGIGVVLPTVAHKVVDPVTDEPKELKKELVLTIPINWEYSF
jgi:hypothetical protein